MVKEFYVFDVLGQIATLTAPAKNLVFKGGTALNKVYLGKLQRFSEDLDFDLDGESMAETRSYCERLAKGLVGYKISDLRKVRNTIQFECEYENLLGGTNHVRVDVAAKRIITEKPPLIKPAVSDYTGRYVTGFYVYSMEDLVARKMNALRDRCEGKDIYDVYSALPLCGKMEAAISKMLISEKSRDSFTEFVQKTLERLRTADHKKLRNLTNPFIPVGNRPKDWLELKNDLVMRLERLQ